ncbi:MAG: hypothetical protein JJE36_06010 [Coriobacteriia bacterium]|nr:hypothetical protein [Coriobacteriia bacterium]
MKKLLFSRKSECIQPLRSLIEKQTHRTLVMWTLDCAPRILAIFEDAYPDDFRPRTALDMATAWSRGAIKMSVAKKAILSAHNAATDAEENPAAQAAARACGHAAATVHVETHALGLVFYGLTAFVYATGTQDTDEIVTKELAWFYNRLLHWEANTGSVTTPWADFLLKEAPNKERLLHLKEEEKASEKSGL